MRQHASQYQPRPLFTAPIHTIITLDRSSVLPCTAKFVNDYVRQFFLVNCQRAHAFQLNVPLQVNLVSIEQRL